MRVVVAIFSGLLIGLGAALVLFVLLVFPGFLSPGWRAERVWPIVGGGSLIAGLSSFVSSLKPDGKRFRLW